MARRAGMKLAAAAESASTAIAAPQASRAITVDVIDSEGGYTAEMIDELRVPVQGVVGEIGLDAAAPAAAALRAAPAQAHMTEFGTAEASPAILEDHRL